MILIDAYRHISLIIDIAHYIIFFILPIIFIDAMLILFRH